MVPKYTLDKGKSLKGKLYYLHDKFTPSHLDGVNSGCTVNYQGLCLEYLALTIWMLCVKPLVGSTCWRLDSTQRIDPFRPPSLLLHFLVKTGPAS